MKEIKRYFFIATFCILGTVLFPAEVIKGVFWGHGALVFDHQGNMYFGYDAYSISKYSPGGELLLRIGREGEGPGDIKRISRYAFNTRDNALYVTEFYNGNRRVSRFSTDGKFIGAWNFEFDWLKYGVVSDIDFDKDGNVYVIAQKRNPRRYKDYIVTNEVYDLLKFSPEGKFLKKIYSLNSDFDAEKPGNFQVTIPFQNALSWIVCRDKIIIKEISGDSIQVFSTDGEGEKIIPFPIKSEKVTEEDLDAWEKNLESLPFIQKLKSMGRANVHYWRKTLTFPEYKPNSSGRILSDSKGNVYLRQYTRYKKKDPTWYKVDLQTGKIETLKFQPGEELARIWRNHFYLYKVIEDKGEEIETIIKLSEEELSNR